MLAHGARALAARALHPARPPAHRGRARRGARARRAARPARAARLRPRRVGVPAARRCGRTPARSCRGPRRRSSSSARSPRSPASRRRASSTSARARGAIALAIADERPDARVTATDVSPDALALARENAERLGLAVELRRDEPARRPRRAVRPRRLEPAVRPRGRARRRCSPRCATGSRGSRVVGDGQTEGSRARPRGVLAPAARRARDATRTAPARSRALLDGLGYARGYDHARISPGGSGWSRGDGAGRGSRRRSTRSAPGEPVLLPADGVYGLCASAYREAPVRRLYELKGRGAAAADGDDRRERRHAARVRAGAPRPRRGDRARAAAGPVHARPAEPGAPLPVAERRERPTTIGVRVAELPRRGAARARRGRRGRRDERERARRARRREPRRGARSGSAPAAGRRSTRARSPATPSTVIDFTGDEPRRAPRGARRRPRRRAEAPRPRDGAPSRTTV